MKRVLKYNVFIFLISISFNTSLRAENKAIVSFSELKNLFSNPPSEYRSAPLWDWNDQISKDGIDFQLNEFKKAGIGGVFVHARPGLLTDYLSADWFNLFDYTVKKGKELDMKVWIYDENSYPTGFAGGHVPAQMPDSYKQGTGLALTIQKKLNVKMSDTISVVLKKNENGFVDISKSIDVENGQDAIYYIFRKTYSEKSTWYGGFPYVDLIYKGVTEKFIDITMTKGYEKSKSEFGRTVAGVFSDEPNIEAPMAKGSLRWTPDLMEAFQKRWGYDLTVNLPSIIEETGNWKKVRHDYYELLLELFVDRWAKPYNKYCESNGLIWTGHYWEHGWPEPTHGFDEMAFYMYHQMPGVDMLGNVMDTIGLGMQFGNDRAIRELRSAANQGGRSRTLSETYGGGGYAVNFETQKRLLDWEVVLGVNFVCQHLSYFSLNGVRKFDYPLSFSYHEPWWNNYKTMGDYIGRISMAMSAGKQINKTLLLQPNSSAWMYFCRKEKSEMVTKIQKDFKHFVYNLEQAHIEYDLGSENVLKNYGSVAGDNLRVGKCDYSTIIIPAEMLNIESSTLRLLKEYLKNGGKVLSFNKNIGFVDGEESSKVIDLAKTYPNQWIFASNLSDSKTVELLRHDDFSLINENNNGMLYHQRRVLNDGQLLLFVNSHDTKSASASCTVVGKQVTKLDLMTGKKYSYPSKCENNKVTFNIELQPVGSALFVVTDKKTDALDMPTNRVNERVIKSSSAISVKAESENIMMLNYLDLKTAKSDKKDVYFMDGQIGLFKDNGVAMGNPWQHKIQYKKTYLELDTLFKENSAFEATYHLQINENLNLEDMKSIRAVVERTEFWQVSINGNVVQKLENAYWIDKQFPVFAVGKYLKKGDNILTIKAPRMNILAEVMPIYFLGHFLVKPAEKGFEIANGTITSLGIWHDLGLPFYSQKVAYNQAYQVRKLPESGYKVKLGKWNGTVSEVFVNGKSAGIIACKPYEIDVSSLIKNGNNEITVKVTGSLKNTFGYFYLNYDSGLSWPLFWNSSPKKVPSASEYFFKDYGLFEKFDLIEQK